MRRVLRSILSKWRLRNEKILSGDQYACGTKSSRFGGLSWLFNEILGQACGGEGIASGKAWFQDNLFAVRVGPFSVEQNAAVRISARRQSLLKRQTPRYERGVVRNSHCPLQVRTLPSWQRIAHFQLSALFNPHPIPMLTGALPLERNSDKRRLA